MPRVVLVTGVSRHLGGRLARRLQSDPAIESVIGVDVVRPRADLGRTQYVRADIRNPTIAKVVTDSDVDTVVHANVIATPEGAGGRASMKAINVVGTMQLLAACQKAPSVRRLVVRSTSAVYGSSSRNPGVFTEDMEPRRPPGSGYAKDASEVEGYVRGFSRRRPDVAVTVLRFTSLVGPAIDTPLTRYFSLPVLPTVLGVDPRLQFVHEDDALEVLHRATLDDRPGTFNVSGAGVLFLSQAARRAGRPTVPVLAPTLSLAARIARGLGLVDVSAEHLSFLTGESCVDNFRLTNEFGHGRLRTSLEAFDDFVRSRGLRCYLPQRQLAALERRALERLGDGGLGGGRLGGGRLGGGSLVRA